MKMDKNVDGNGGDSPPLRNGVDDSRQSVADTLNEILEIFTNRIPNGTVSNGPSDDSRSSANESDAVSGTNVLPDLFQQLPYMNHRSGPAANVVDGIDPSSPLGRSLQMKFTELEEISRRLKTRLNQVVCDGEILLSPEADSNVVDIDLEWDLNTDSHAEDLTPQEFLQLVQSQMACTSQHSLESSENPDDISK